MTRVVVAGGEIVDGRRHDNDGREHRERIDVVIDRELGIVVGIGPDLAGAAGSDDLVLDATGCVVAPGLVDLHAHLGQPGHEPAETIESASRAAALGGYTAVVALADTDPCVDTAAVVAEIRALARSALCEIAPAGALTMGRQGHQLAPLAELAEAGVRIFSDAPRSLADAAVMRRALDYAAGFGEAAGLPLVVAQRCVLDALADRAVMHEGEWSSRLGLPGQPALAEELIVMRELALARLTGARIHLQQISTAGSVALIRAAKVEGVPVTADVAPEHLVLTDAACAGYDPNLKLDPPLRTAGDVCALRAGLIDGTIDAIATGHRPCTIDAKELPFDQAPPGIIGLETALALLLTELTGSGRDGTDRDSTDRDGTDRDSTDRDGTDRDSTDRDGTDRDSTDRDSTDRDSTDRDSTAPGETPTSLGRLLAAMSWQPAAIAGLGDRHGGPIEEGRAANLVVVDPGVVWTFDAAKGASRSANSAHDGRTFTGRVRHTIAAGEAVVINGEAQR